MKFRTLLLVASLVGVATIGRANPADAEAVKATAMDYIQGYYQGDAERMERSLHPDLAKRTPVINAQGRTGIQHMGALALVQAARAGRGRSVPEEKRIAEFTLHELDGGIAVGKLVSANFTDWFHFAKVNDRWVIVNVIWRMNPAPAT